MKTSITLALGFLVGAAMFARADDREVSPEVRARRLVVVHDNDKPAVVFESKGGGGVLKLFDSNGTLRVLVSGRESPEIALYDWHEDPAVRIRVPKEDGHPSIELYHNQHPTWTLTAAPSLTLRAKKGDKLEYRVIDGRFYRRVVPHDGGKPYEVPMRRRERAEKR